MELGVLRLWNYVELFWNSLDNASSSIVLYLEMKVEVEIGVHDIMSRFTPRNYVLASAPLQHLGLDDDFGAEGPSSGLARGRIKI